MCKISLYIAFLLFSIQSLYAQSTLQTPISLHLEEVTYQQALSTIAEITGVSFVYSSSVLPANKISLRLKNQDLSQVLRILFANTRIVYVFHKQEIILKLGKQKSKQKSIISGCIKDEKTGEVLPGVLIAIEHTNRGVVSNDHGFYSLSLAPANYRLFYSYLGYRRTYRQVLVSADTVLDIFIQQKNKELEEVVVQGMRNNEAFFSTTANDGLSINAKTVQQMPSFLGEYDLIKSFQLLPGIQTSTEGSAGMVVRGGSIEQNLILLDDVPLYNTAHLFGFFSVFNPDIVQNASLHKGSIPANYGGRLSSVLNVNVREGNKYKRKWTGGVGTISTRLTFETPINEGKGSVIISGRRTYLDFLLNSFSFASNNSPSNDVFSNNFFFHDIYLKGTYQLGRRSKIQALGYYGRDRVSFQAGLRNIWDSHAYSLGWNYIINSRMFSNMTIFRSHILSRTSSQLFSSLGNQSKYRLASNGFKQRFTFYIQPDAHLDFGFQTTYQAYLFGEILPLGENSQIEPKKGNRVYAIESAAYASLNYFITPKWRINLGLRFSRFDNIGPSRQYIYNTFQVVAPETSTENIIDTIHHKGAYHTYQGFEPRVALKMMPNKNSSFKLSYDLTRQYIHRFTNANTASPADIWVSASPYIKPQIAYIFSADYQQKLLNNTYSFSLGTYYKMLRGQLDSKNSVNLLLSDHFETEVLEGTARSYGMEWIFKKNNGRMTGWLSYTYSKTDRIIPGINDGKPYAPLFDKRHDFSLVCSYDIAPRINISATWVYSSGIPFSPPSGKYEINGHVVPQYQSRNSFRLPDTHRMDLSITFFRKKIQRDRKNESNFNISIYNIYSKKNTFAYVFRQSSQKPDETEVVKLYLFKIFPSFTYNFKF